MSYKVARNVRAYDVNPIPFSIHEPFLAWPLNANNGFVFNGEKFCSFDFIAKRIIVPRACNLNSSMSLMTYFFFVTPGDC